MTYGTCIGLQSPVHAHTFTGLTSLADAHGLDLVEASTLYEPWLVRGEN